jgi:hypothetical protein
MSKFTLDVAKFAEKTKSTVSESARAIKIELFNGVIRDTRVDTGRLRGNWQFSSGAPISYSTLRLDPVSQGQDGGAAQQDVLVGVKPDTLDYISNNLAYAEIWEERDAMIQKNLARVIRNVRRIARG